MLPEASRIKMRFCPRASEALHVVGPEHVKIANVRKKISKGKIERNLDLPERKCMTTLPVWLILWQEPIKKAEADPGTLNAWGGLEFTHAEFHEHELEIHFKPYSISVRKSIKKWPFP
jgi:hypothetical protein